jgi:hypothetical protein
VVVDVDGIRIHFCCNGCKTRVAKANSSQQSYMVFEEKSFKQGFAKAPATEGIGRADGPSSGALK